MRSKNVQMSLFDIYSDVCSAMDENKSRFLSLLEEHIDFRGLIPVEFYRAFYRHSGRPREYPLEGFLKFCVLQKTIGIEIFSSSLLYPFSILIRGACSSPVFLLPVFPLLFLSLLHSPVELTFPCVTPFPPLGLILLFFILHFRNQLY